jgi:excisionase family DNA binding protein
VSDRSANVCTKASIPITTAGIDGAFGYRRHHLLSFHATNDDQYATPADRFLTIAQVASELGVHPSTVRRFLDAGTLPGVRLGDRDGRGQLACPCV